MIINCQVSISEGYRDCIVIRSFISEYEICVLGTGILAPHTFWISKDDETITYPYGNTER